MKKLIIVLLFFFTGYVFAGNTGFTISGKIENVKANAPVYVYLVDEEKSKIPFTGIQEIKIVFNDQIRNTGFAEFIFHDVPAGIYGIRCYQDLNKNGKLDKGLSGPKEPWGLSWNGIKASKWPSFKNFRFTLSKNTDNIIIELKK